jgi:hypothetical protein
MSSGGAAEKASNDDAFPILTAPGLVAGAVRTVPAGALAYVNLLAEGVVRLTAPAHRGHMDAAASSRRSTVYAGAGAGAAAGAFVRQRGK